MVAILSCIYWERRQPFVRWIGLLFFVGFLANTSGQLFILFKIPGLMNFTADTYDLVAITVLSYVYYLVLNKRYGTVFLAVAVVFDILAIINLIFFNSPNLMFVAAIINIVYCILYFYHLMVELPVIHVHKLPMFWINSGFLIYNAGTLFLFAFTSYLIDVLKSDMITYWTFHNVLNIVNHLMVLVALYYDLQALHQKPAVRD